MLELHNRDNGVRIADQVRTADSFLSRLCGLLFTASLPSGHALHLKPCRAVHSLFMRYPIDVIYLDAFNVIVGIDEALKPNRIGSAVPQARSVVELPAGSVKKKQIEVGHKLEFKSN